MTDGFKDTSNLVVGEVSSNLTFGTAAVKNTIIGVNDWTDAGLTTGFNNTTIGYNSGKKITTGPDVITGGGYEDRTVTGDDVRKAKDRYEQQFFDKGKVPPLGSRPTSFKTKLNQRNLQKRLDYINYLQKNIN